MDQRRIFNTMSKRIFILTVFLISIVSSVFAAPPIKKSTVTIKQPITVTKADTTKPEYTYISCTYDRQDSYYHMPTNNTISFKLDTTNKKVYVGENEVNTTDFTDEKIRIDYVYSKDATWTMKHVFVINRKTGAMNYAETNSPTSILSALFAPENYAIGSGHCTKATADSAF